MTITYCLDCKEALPPSGGLWFDRKIFALCL